MVLIFNEVTFLDRDKALKYKIMHHDQLNRTCVLTQGGNNKISEKVKEDFLRVMKLNLGFEG